MSIKEAETPIWAYDEEGNYLGSDHFDAMLDAAPVGGVESTLERLLSEQDTAIAAHAASFTARLRSRGEW